MCEQIISKGNREENKLYPLFILVLNHLNGL